MKLPKNGEWPRTASERKPRLRRPQPEPQQQRRPPTRPSEQLQRRPRQKQSQRLGDEAKGLGLIIETHNLTSWGGGGGFADVLVKSRAHVLMLQEVHADKTKDKELRSLAGKLGWKCVSSLAIQKNGGSTGGVMICTRSWLGLSLLDSTEEIVP